MNTYNHTFDEIKNLKGFSAIEYMIAGVCPIVTARMVRCPKKRAIAQQEEYKKSGQRRIDYIKNLINNQ